MSVALARKYRPRNFAEVAVQSHVSTTLRNAIARGRVAHAYLLCGPRGTGKTTLARVLAMALNCENRQPAGSESAGEPCGTCGSCQRIWSGSSSLDVVEIDAASNRGVDDARELRERAMYAPSAEDGYKVYIVDEAHMLTREAWNALLKILEEPPPRVVFVFATTDPQKIAQAAAPVLSRLQRFDLRRIGPAEIQERLAMVLDSEGVAFEADALGMIARTADGGLRDALSLADQVISLGSESAVTAERVREALGLVAEDEYLAMLDIVAERRAGDVFAEVARLADAGVDFGTFLVGFTDVLRALLAMVLGGAPPETSDRLRGELDSRRDAFQAGDLLRMLHLIGEIEPRFRRSGQQRLLLELVLVRFALLDRSVELSDLLQALGGGGAGGGGGGGSAEAPSRRTGSGAGASARSGGGRSSAGASAGAGGSARTSASEASASAAASPSPVAAAPVSPPGRRAPLADAPPPWEGPPPWESESEPAPRQPRGTAGRAGSTAAPAGATATAAVPDLNRVVERWGEVAAAIHASGRALLAPLVAHSEPLSITGDGALVLQVADDTAYEALGSQSSTEAVLATVRGVFPGVRRLVLRKGGAPSRRPGRMTTESVAAERVAALRRRDPAIGEAIDALDLELLE